MRCILMPLLHQHIHLDASDRMSLCSVDRQEPESPVNTDESKDSSTSEANGSASNGEDRRHLTFSIQGGSSDIEEPPWGSPYPDGTAILPPFVNERRYARKTNWGRSETSNDENRLHVWAVVQLAVSDPHHSLPTHLFTSSRGGGAAALQPTPRSLIPFQWIHADSHAISNSLADRACSALGVEGLLGALNDVLESSLALEDPGVQETLEHFASSAMDFGQAYGHLRIIQKGNLLGFLTMLEVRRQEDEAMRQYATQPTSIDDAAIPPRRVWDLYSNRVLPFYAINEESVQAIAVNLWTVSHSWVINDARQLLWTPINSREWPVPIPRDTTLEHVRVELLNLGAEYAWLDVLCLRQYRGQEHELSRVGPENIERALQAQEWVRCEQLRADEWRLDVPTIGSVYSVQLPCVTYFNGLGLPFDPSPALLSSDRHWLNRVWTLQEGSDEWILGGATGASSADARDFFASHALPALRHRLTEHSAVWAEDMRRRHCTTELDRVHGLAYIFKCGTMPVYDEGVAPEDAWAMLLQHIPGTARRDLAARHVQHSPNDTTLFPSWTQFLRWTLPGDMAPGRHGIELVGTNRSGAPYPVFYSDIGVDYWGPFHIARLDCGSSNNSDELIELRAPDKSHEPYRMTGRVGNALSEGMPYVLVEIHAEAGVWIVAEVKKERKTFLGRPALDLVKRGGLLVSGKLRVPLPNGPKFATAVYRCDNPEVQETS